MRNKKLALKLCQEMAWTGTDSVDLGFTSLPIDVAKACATIAVNLLISEARGVFAMGDTQEQIDRYEQLKLEINNV